MTHRRTFSFRLLRPIVAITAIVVSTHWTTSCLAADGDPGQPANKAERLIDDAIHQVANLGSITADMSQTIAMLNETFTIKGRYLKAPGRRLYLALEVPDTPFQTVQVCDGETLWDFQEIPTSRAFSRLSLKPVLKRLASPDLDRKTREEILNQVGFAGTETLLVELRKLFKFDFNDKTDDVIDRKPVWILHGQWRKEPGMQAPDSSPARPMGLPPFIPGDATLYLGKTDGWPYKLVLAGRQPAVQVDTRRLGANGERIGARSSIEKIEPTKIILTYSNVKINAVIPVDAFQPPAPPDLSATDRTDELIKKLDDAIKIETQKKKSERERKDGPVQGPVIEIPIPPLSAAPGPHRLNRLA